MERTASRAPTAFLLLCLVAGIGLLLTQLPRLVNSMPDPLPEVLRPTRPQPLPPLDPHASKHPEAPYIHEYLSTHDVRFCRFDCGNKGTKYYCRIGTRTALAVVIEGVKTITAFWVDNSDYDYNPRDDAGCRPFIDVAHP